MSLKDLISTLIESAFGSKKMFISQQSLPSVVYSQVDVPDTYNQNRQMICPCDGWATGNLLYRLFLATLMHGAVFGSRVKKGILLQLVSRVLADRHFDLYSRGTAQANLAFEGGAL